MRDIISKSALGVAICIGLGACSTNQSLIHQKSGVAIQQAAESHIVDKTATPGAPEQHPEKAKAAIDRYLSDNVKQPEGDEFE